MKLVSYLRVSTREQGDSGLGIEAQRSAVETYTKSVSGTIIAEYLEVESGKNNKRPKLAAAIAQAKADNATLVVAKLDRLARNVAFTAALMESGADFVCCDNPTADRFTIHIFAALAEREAKMISERTKAALGALKARGQKLGNPNAKKDAITASKSNQTKAAEFLAEIRPLAERKRRAGWNQEQIANWLTSKGILTRRGKPWSQVTVGRLLAG